VEENGVALGNREDRRVGPRGPVSSAEHKPRPFDLATQCREPAEVRVWEMFTDRQRPGRSEHTSDLAEAARLIAHFAEHRHHVDHVDRGTLEREVGGVASDAHDLARGARTAPHLIPPQHLYLHVAENEPTSRQLRRHVATVVA